MLVYLAIYVPMTVGSFVAVLMMKDENGEPIYYIDRQKLLWAKEKEERERVAREDANSTTPETETLKTKELEVVDGITRISVGRGQDCQRRRGQQF